MRKRAIGLYWALIAGGCLVVAVSCDDKPGQSAPQEYDPQIDSVAAAPLPTIVVGMAEGVSSNAEEAGGRIPPSGVYEAEETTEPVMPGESEVSEPPSVPRNPADPNTF
jgi:hypothetical protein